MEKVLQTAAGLLKNGQSFVLATIINDNRGGSPRGIGSKMIVMPDESIFATIGGGALELMAIKRSMKLFETKGHDLYTFNMTNKDASVADMVCGGVVDIYLNYIDATDPVMLDVFSKAALAEQEGANAWLVYVIAENYRYMSFVRDGIVTGNAPEKMHHQLKAPAFGLHMHPELVDEQRVYAEPILGAPTAYIFGAGHISLGITKILTQIGFKTVVIDDREQYANAERFPDSKVLVIDSMENIPSLPIHANSYLIIVTRGHQNDRYALEYALKHQPAYIGMIGSPGKNKVVYNYLFTKGFTEADIAKVHAPIGLAIGAQTPDEIAVAIAAEIIQVKSELEVK